MGGSLLLFPGSGLEPRGTTRSWLRATASRKASLGLVPATGRGDPISDLVGNCLRPYLAVPFKVRFCHARLRNTRSSGKETCRWCQRMAPAGYRDQKAATGGQINSGDSNTFP